MTRAVLSRPLPSAQLVRLAEAWKPMAKPKGNKTRSLFPAPPESEVEAYDFIRRQLRALGWKVRNPSLNDGGQVWTQNQCLADPDIRAALGKKRPENVVKLSETLRWVIEAKPLRTQLDLAVAEATDYYAKPINELPGPNRAVLVSGVAGTEAANYSIRTRILLNGTWHTVTINGQEATGLLAPRDIQFLLDNQTSDVHEFAPPQLLFVQAAERINGILHLGGINKNDRARVMAALLLSVAEEEPPNIETTLQVLIGEINARSEAVLRNHGKPDFAPFVRILYPTNRKNHVKYKNAIVRTIQELLNLNIRSAMNSSTDVLGQFYEVFLKYGNGAKEIGIVLTPRHVTRFAVEATGVADNHIVLDPACGTGGFLVAAFDHVRQNSPAHINRFKKRNLFGIEQEPPIAALAIVNMIFRGDGKNNITEGNAFTTWLTKRTIGGDPSASYVASQPSPGSEPVTRVLMNPPFALRGSTEKEFHFVRHALSVMADGGILFSLLPLDAMFGSQEEKAWRKDELLRQHTLLAVVSFPMLLFSPAAKKQVVGVFIKKGTPHPRTQHVFWGRVARDGFLMVKAKRLPAAELDPPRVEEDDIPKLLPHLRNHIANPGSVKINVSELCKTSPINFGDPLLELLPEVYLDSTTPSADELARKADSQIREDIAALVDMDLRHNAAPVGRTIIDVAQAGPPSPAPAPARVPKIKHVPLTAVFDLRRGDFHNLSALNDGSIPVVTCTEAGAGVLEAHEVPEGMVYRDALTIAYNGSPLTTKIHPYRFATKDDVAAAMPNEEWTVEALVFVQMMLNSERWRFSYYRKCFHGKLIRTTIPLPVKADGSPDIDFMTAFIRSRPNWWFLSRRFGAWTPTAPALQQEEDETEGKEAAEEEESEEEER